MPDLGSSFKQEIARIARKQIRAETESTQKAVSAYRHQIASLKRDIAALHREVSKLLKEQGNVSQPAATQDSSPTLRFRAEGFKSHRERLGLSAREIGLLVGASPLSVYKWESGQARPRSKHLEAIAALRKMGKREAAKALELLAR